ncbi:hypothetical protein CEXT_174131 [Caerostris extrusa]|uniref:Uncharacterized protein n=1 Tax=Caerostris extrusa TaxID=172846 RepID=A0AAV4WF23_CAEEX|nr:hypothetical protein CEXT_174131 [Caerostris extrusa]
MNTKRLDPRTPAQNSIKDRFQASRACPSPEKPLERGKRPISSLSVIAAEHDFRNLSTYSKETYRTNSCVKSYYRIL